MKKRRATTLKDIARRLEFSVSTVSRALSDHPDISQETKNKVQKVADELKYVPNIFARGFRKHKTNIIGVIVPDITHYFTTTIIKGILSQATLQGYRVIISESGKQVSKQEDMLKTMLQFDVDGILLSLDKATRNINTILEIKNTIPLILFDKASNKIPCTQIVINEEEASFNAIDHLINIGKKRIAIIKENEYSFNSENRYNGYLRALKEHNIEVDEKIILSVDDISMKHGSRLTNILLSLKNRPDAIFAITDSAAIGAIKVLKKFNIKIPEEIAVLGFSNSAHSTIIEPNLTTIDQPGERMGVTAVQYLIEEIEDASILSKQKIVEIKSELIVRDSTFKA
ncbi:MAG: LacI family DNA-binding transcriptional regulator [bacterium]